MFAKMTKFIWKDVIREVKYTRRFGFWNFVFASVCHMKTYVQVKH